MLPNGRILPPLPAHAMRPSIHAEMLREHGARVHRFEPGVRPHIDLPENAQGNPGGPTGSVNAPVVLAAWAPDDAQPAPVDAALPNGLRREVQGFLPYWMLDPTNLERLRYDRLSTIAYFDVPVRTDGYLDKSGSGWSGWTSAHMTDVINRAHARGVKVILTVSMMSWDGGSGMATLLGNSTYRARLVQEIAAAIRLRNADGVNIDFEPVNTGEREEFTSFIRQLKAGLVNAGVRSYLSVCTMAGAATWATGYDVAGLTASGAADHLFVMGYDYSWSGSERAGAVAPVDSSYQLDVRSSIDDHLALVSGSKLVWGVPYYGRSWPTTSNTLNAYTRPDTATSYTRAWYYTAGLDAAATYGRKWDAAGQVPWFANWDSANGTWREGYYDDATSLGIKYDLINQRGLGGAGIWHLMMDEDRTELWTLLGTKFGDSTPPRITSKTPGASATNVWTGTNVTVTFSEPVTGVWTGTYYLRDTSTRGVVSATVTYDAATRRAVLNPSSALAGGRKYQVELSASIRDSGGNSLPWAPWTFTTTTDTTPPQVTSKAPGPNATNVWTGTNVTVTFSEPVTGVWTGTFYVRDTTTQDAVTATVAYDATARRAVLNPSSALAAGRRYQVELSGSIRDRGGNPVPWAPWTFTTTTDVTPPSLTSRVPGPSATNVSRDTNVTVTFSEPVTGVWSGTFYVRDTSTNGVVSATVTYDAATRRAVLNPSAPLTAGRRYQVELSGSIRDLGGNPLPWKPWQFTTAR